MAFKIILSFCALVAAVTAQYGGYGSQGGYGGHTGYGHVSYKEEPYDPHPQYKFEYSVQDAHTHDIKSQQEERNGDTVHGNYKLLEADGSERYVEYTADHKNGFNAVVHRQHNTHPVVHHAPVYHAPVYHAPVVKYHSAPSHSSSSYSSHY